MGGCSLQDLILCCCLIVLPSSVSLDLTATDSLALLVRLIPVVNDSPESAFFAGFFSMLDS